MGKSQIFAEQVMLICVFRLRTSTDKNKKFKMISAKWKWVFQPQSGASKHTQREVRNKQIGYEGGDGGQTEDGGGGEKEKEEEKKKKKKK